MFSSNGFSKGIALAPLGGILSTEFSRTSGTFTDPNFKPERNIQAWGHLKRNGVASRGFFKETGSTVVRFWASWYDIQLYGPDDFNQESLTALDANIAAAKAANLDVILTSRGYPGWATGYAAQRADGRWSNVPTSGNAAQVTANWLDPEFPPGDAAANERRAKAMNAFTAARADQEDPAGDGPLLMFRFPGKPLDASGAILPANLDTAYPELVLPPPDGQPAPPWYRWIEFLARRYHPSNPSKTIASAPDNTAGAKIDVLEIVNEPNGPEGWPQTGLNTKVQIAPIMTAAMMKSAAALDAAVNSGGGTPLRFAAPACSDLGPSSKQTGYERSNRKRSTYDVFLLRLGRLIKTGGDYAFAPSANYIFSHHNYYDLEKTRTGKPGKTKASYKTNSSGWVLRFMKRGQGTGFRWAAWPTNTASGSRLIITEGGVRRGSLTEKQQADKLTNRVKKGYRQGRYGTGDGIALFVQFLSWEDDGRGGKLITQSHLLSRTFGSADVTDLTNEPDDEQYAKNKLKIYNAWADV